MIIFLKLPKKFQIPDKIKNDSHPNIVKEMNKLLTTLKKDGIIHIKDGRIYGDHTEFSNVNKCLHEAWDEIYYDYKNVFKKYRVNLRLYSPDYYSAIVNLNKFI